MLYGAVQCCVVCCVVLCGVILTLSLSLSLSLVWTGKTKLMALYRHHYCAETGDPKPNEFEGGGDLTVKRAMVRAIGR